MNHLLLLFVEFFKIALFTIGGGLAMLPLIEDTFVRKHHLLTQDDMSDMISLTQTIPGLIAINSAVFVGNRLAGWKGSLIATLGVVSPSIGIIILIAKLFPLQEITNPHILSAFNCVRACVLGLFVILAWRLGKALLKNCFDWILFVLLFGLLLTGIGPVWLVITACVVGGFYETWIKRKLTEGKKHD